MGDLMGQRYTVTYVGHGKDDPSETKFRGVVFPRGTPVGLDVATPEGVAMIAKLKGNNAFTVTEEGAAPPPADEPADEPAPKPKKAKG